MAKKDVIHLPGGKLHKFLHSTPQREEPPEAFEVYPDEYPKIKAVGDRINAMFARKAINNDEWPDLIEKIIEMYDEVGFVVGVEIMDALGKDGQHITDQNGFPMRVPSVAFLGRSVNKETEIDHDRIAYGVVRGQVDGVKGYIREDGQLHEDPIKKNIY